jgi:hypothetical protein
MNLQEVVKLADELVFARTGQHLSDVQDTILRGTWQHQDYKEIAKQVNLSEARVREVGMELWQTLSDELGEKVTKSNFRPTMERLQFSIDSQYFARQDSVQIGCINYCGESRHSPHSSQPHQETQARSNPAFNHDLSEMPRLGNFYNRVDELERIKTVILTDKVQLLTITGIIGSGKTALAIKLVQEIKHEFECVVWRNLETGYAASNLKTDIINLFAHNDNKKLSQMSAIKYLQKHRCLIILDNIHNLFMREELAGQYQLCYEDYRSFFKKIIDLSHQSCFLLVGWEAPRDIAQIQQKNIPHFTIAGLDSSSASRVLADQGLEIDNRWKNLIDLYQGNPLWLKIVAHFILELGLNVTDLFHKQPVLPQDLKGILRQSFAYLSETETELLSQLAREDDAIALVKLLETTQMPLSDLLDALQSLCRRCWLEKTDKVYVMSSILKQYILQL